jgi:prevent-host-death family protein
MRISVSEAKGQLTDLVRRAEGGEEVVLTRHGEPVARLSPVRAAVDAGTKRRVIAEIRREGRLRATPGPCAARSQDFLYDEDGLPK